MLDRDYKSAPNRLHNGLQLLHLPAERREYTPVETAMQSEQEAAALKEW
jgi:hypothetical protein